MVLFFCKMSAKPFPQRVFAKGFTMVEMLVSITVLAMVVILTFQVVSHTSALWLSSSAKLTSFEIATAGFDMMTRKISQATLNTYWDYEPKPGPANWFPPPPTAYVRASELHFCVASGSALLSSTNATSHAIFFQAPLGYTTTYGKTPNFAPLVGMINTVGYYIAYTPQKSLPSFLNATPTWRYRLYEMLEPSEQFRGYSEIDVLTRKFYETQDWFATNRELTSRKIADNVIGLIIRARYPDPQNPEEYVETYMYDSGDNTAYYRADGQRVPTAIQKIPTYNQLPPTVSVTMIVMDENSAKRLGDDYHKVTQPVNTFIKTENFEEDLKTWTDNLSSMRPQVTFRIYTANIAIREAKWSSN